MKAKLPSLTLIALFSAVGSSGALAHEDYSNSDVANTHWVGHETSPAGTYMGPTKPWAQTDVADFDWIGASPAVAGKPRGAEGPVKGRGDYTPDPSTSSDAMSLEWISPAGNK